MILFCLLSICLSSDIRPDNYLINGRKIEQAYWKGIQTEYVEGQIVIKKASGSSADKVIDALLKFNLQETRSFDKLGIGLFSVPENTSIFPVIEALENDPLIEWAQPNMISHMAATQPNDEYFNKQWGLHNTGQSPPGGTPDADIDAPEGWDIETGSSTVILGILDNGIPLVDGELSHPDLDNTERIILGSDFVGDGNGVKDEGGHGTHVAGIAAAETNNNIGVAGVGWNCKLRIVQVADKNGLAIHDWIYNGIKECVDNGCKVINYSGGGNHSPELESAVQYAKMNDCLIIAATGRPNDEHKVEYPAAYSKKYPNVIAVGATDHNDNKASYSNYGPELNVVAPGGYGGTLDENDIYSTTPNYSFELESAGVTQVYGYMCGTSMAAPQVAGLAALILSQHPDWPPTVVRYAIEKSADDLGESGWDEEYGWGRINAHGALTFTVETDLVLQNITIEDDETQRYLAFNSIQAAGEDQGEDTYFIIENGGNCEMKAGNEIRLKPGFEARAGCKFASSINPALNPSLQINLSEPYTQSTKNPSFNLTEETKEIKESIPKVFSCAQNKPNPFNISTTIKYGLPKKSNVNLTIFNLAGQAVRTLVNGQQPAGFKSARWDGRTDAGREVPQGIYFYTLKAGDEFKQTYKMIVVK